MKHIKYLTVGVLALSLAACAQDTGQKQTMGTIGGAVLGGLAGSAVGSGSGRLIAVGVGTLLGAWAGSEIGKSLDKADRLYMQQTTNQALESGRSNQSYGWTNPDSGHAGTVVPQPAYQNTSGQYCREYQQTVTIGGQTEDAFGTACRQPDGSWQIVS